jgi:hypothetical protein
VRPISFTVQSFQFANPKCCIRLARGQSTNEVLILDGGPDDDVKLAAMQAKYPGEKLIIREIVDSPARFAPVPEHAENAGPSSVAGSIDDDAVARARARLQELQRGQF